MVQAVLRLLQRRRRACVVHATEAAGHAAAIARALPRDTPAVLVAGGDGTLREAAEGLLGRSIPLAGLPTGTENILARELGWRCGSSAAVNTLLHGRVRRIDAGSAAGRIFLVVAGVGFDAEVVGRVSRRRGRHISYLNYGWPLWRTFWEHRYPDLQVAVDGRMVFEGRGLVIAGNVARYGIGLRILERADPADGLLDVCVFPCSHSGKLLAHAAWTLLRRHVRCGGAVYAQGRRLQLRSSSRVPVELDGDVAGWLPVDLEIHPQALLVLQDPGGMAGPPPPAASGAATVEQSARET